MTIAAPIDRKWLRKIPSQASVDVYHIWDKHHCRTMCSAQGDADLEAATKPMYIGPGLICKQRACFRAWQEAIKCN